MNREDLVKECIDLEALAEISLFNIRHIKEGYLQDHPRTRSFCLTFAHILALKLSEDQPLDKHFISSRRNISKNKIIHAIECIANEVRDDVGQKGNLTKTPAEMTNIQESRLEAESALAERTMAHEILAICKMYYGYYDAAIEIIQVARGNLE
jgi:hypothetical protein